MPLPTKAAATAEKIEGKYTDTPDGWASYWQREFTAAREEGGEDWFGFKVFQSRAAKVVKRYRANKKGSKRQNDARINIFPANVSTQRAILVGNTPKCEVTRRHDDPDDDTARVASDILERVLNLGLEEESKGLAFVLGKCTEDRLLPGLCGARVQFSAEFEPVEAKPAIMAACPMCGGAGTPTAPMLSPDAQPAQCPTCQGAGQVEQAPAVPASEKQTEERADAVYVNWRDKLYSPCRTPDEMRWRAYGADMSRKQLREMFEEGGEVRVTVAGKRDQEGKKDTPWSRARVWEIWSREHGRVFWYVEGHGKCLTNRRNPEGADPLGLEEFFPEPIEMMANATTDAWLPTPDFEYAEDLYNEADDLTARIRGIVRAIKVAGVYDATNKALRRLLDEACELELLPHADFSGLMAKGGLAAAIQLLPVKDIADTLTALVARRNDVIQGIYQITGLGDIIRGQQQQSETATTSAIKARFASVRLQDLQKEVARYATDLQRLRKEVVAKHWTVETIIERSCIMRSGEAKTPEGQQRIIAAAKLIKDRHLDFCVAVKPEQVSLQDFAVLKQQRSDVLSALGQYFGSMMPFLQMCMQAGPEGVKAGLTLVLRNAQWLVAGMPGAGGVEAAIDAFVLQVEKLAQAAQAMAGQPKPPPPPDPKIVAAGIKARGDVQKTQAATQGRLVEIAAETRASMATREHDARMDVATTEAQERLRAVHEVDRVLGGPGGGP